MLATGDTANPILKDRLLLPVLTQRYFQFHTKTSSYTNKSFNIYRFVSAHNTEELRHVVMTEKILHPGKLSSCLI